MSSIGRALTKSDVDNRIYAVVTQLWNALDLANQLDSFMKDTSLGGTDANLTNLGYLNTDLATLRGGIADLGSTTGLWGVAHAKSTPSGSNDYFFRAKQWTTIDYTG